MEILTIPITSTRRVITEKSKPAESMIVDILSGCHTTLNRKLMYWINDDGNVLIEYDKAKSQLMCSNVLIWTFLSEVYALTYWEIKDMLKVIAKKYLKIGMVEPRILILPIIKHNKL